MNRERLRRMKLILISALGFIVTTLIPNPSVDECTSYALGYPLLTLRYNCPCIISGRDIPPYIILYENIVFYILFWSIFYLITFKLLKRIRVRV